MLTGALNVLFLFDRNAGHSVMAEAILRVEGNGRFRAYSATLGPAPAVDADIVISWPRAIYQSQRGSP